MHLCQVWQFCFTTTQSRCQFHTLQFGTCESDTGEQHQLLMLNKASRFSPSPFRLPSSFVVQLLFSLLGDWNTLIWAIWKQLSVRQVAALTRTHWVLHLEEAASLWLKWQQWETVAWATQVYCWKVIRPRNEPSLCLLFLFLRNYRDNSDFF